MSPASTLSPTPTSQLEILPSFMVDDSAGIITGMAASDIEVAAAGGAAGAAAGAEAAGAAAAGEPPPAATMAISASF